MLRHAKKYELTFLHKLAVGVLLFLSVMFFLNPPVYIQEMEGKLQDVSFPFLREGDYVLEITYHHSPDGNSIVIMSDVLATLENQMGAELARKDIPEGAGVVQVPLHLEQNTYEIKILMEMPNQLGYYFDEVHLQRVQLLCKDNYLLGVICIFAAAAIVLSGSFLPKERYQEPLILMLMGLGASLPLFSDAVLAGEDFLFHITRLEGIYQGMRAGEFPVRINSLQTGSFGNLSAAMYPQLFLYPAALLRFADISLILCYKLLITAINVGSALLSFYSVKNISKSVRMGYVAAVLYTFSLYRLTNVYFRAALGEALAMVFLPLVLWGIYEVLWGNQKKWYLLMLGVTGVLQSHVLSMEMCLFFLILEAVIWGFSSTWKEKYKRIVPGIKAIVGTCLLNASFLVPFLFFYGEDLQIFHLESEVADSVIYFTQMFSLYPSGDGKNMSIGSTQGEMPLTIGMSLIVGAVLFCIMMSKRREKKETAGLGRHCLWFGLLALFISSWLFPWNIFNRNELFLKLTTPLQFAWRLLGPASLFLCVVSAIGIVWFASESSGREWVYGVLFVLILSSTSYYFGDMARQIKQVSDEMELEGLGYADALYMYSDGGTIKPLNLDYERRDAVVRTLNGTAAEYSDYEKKGAQVNIMVNPIAASMKTPESAAVTSEGLSEEEYLLFPLYYYPGYEILVNGEKVPVTAQDTLVACRMPEESAYIQVSYKGMPSFKAADIVTLITAIGMAGYVIVKQIKTGNKKKQR